MKWLIAFDLDGTLAPAALKGGRERDPKRIVDRLWFPVDDWPGRGLVHMRHWLSAE